MNDRHILPLHAFIKRLIRNLLIGMVIIALSLGLGMVGYIHYENMNLVDAYVNAAMILSGMGPLQPLQTDEGKIFAGTYALFCGILFLVVIAIIFAPIFHRFFHKYLIKDPN